MNVFAAHALEFPMVLRPIVGLLMRWMLLAGAQVLIVCAPPQAAGAGQRPDILLIMPDQMRGDCLGVAGHPVVRTPHLDQLCREGVRFSKAYTTCPSCIPARHALLTGLFPQTSGMVGYKARPITVPTLPDRLAASGYTTVLVGREMHQLPHEAAYGYQIRELGTTYESGDAYDRFLRREAPESGGIRRLVLDHGLTFNGWETGPWPLAEALHPTDWVVRRSLEMMAEQPHSGPLFLTASFFAPHSPLFPPLRYLDRYLDQNLPAAHGDWEDWLAAAERPVKKEAHRVWLKGEALKRAEAGYYGLITHLDDQLGPLMKAFKERSRSEGRPWVIVFATDHGELLGDHALYRKCEPYEGSAHIPFIIAGAPELGFQAGTVCRQPVCLEDIFPTLTALSGAPAPADLDGVNLVPVLRGEKEEVRPWLHLEHAPCYDAEQAFHALTDGHMKYIWRPLDGSEQLFDLDHDPKEEHDLAPVAAHAVELKRWRVRLIGQLTGRPEGFTDGKRLVPGRPYPPLQMRSRGE